MKQFETELQKLNLYLINMADSVSGNIIQAVNGYFNRDTNVIINDDLIDQLEKVIQEQCVDLM
ncbi:MAG: hypothetical protein ACOYIM_03925, partial [Bacilli bacterium]